MELPGEIVSVNKKGEVIINNKLIAEPYLSYKCALSFFNNNCGAFENIKFCGKKKETDKKTVDRTKKILLVSMLSFLY